MQPSTKSNPVPLARAFETFYGTLNAMMTIFRAEANRDDNRSQADLDIANTILTVLDNAYSESISLQHKLERRIMSID